MLGKIEGRRRTGQQQMRCLDGITDSMDMNSKSRRWWETRTRRPEVLQSMESQSQTRFGDWTTTTKISFGVNCLTHYTNKRLKRTWPLGLAHLLFLGTQTMPPYKRTQSPCWMMRNMWPRHGPSWYPANRQAHEWGQARPFGPTSCMQSSTEPAQPTRRVMTNSNH